MMATSDTSSNCSNQSSVAVEQLGRKKKCHCSKIRKIQSSGVFLVLLWTFAVYAVGSVVQVIQGIEAIIVVLLFCPLAGWLADVCFGRYKILKLSLLFAWISTAGLIILFTLSNAGVNIPSAVMKTASVLIAIPMDFCYASFLANGIPFAMDQMPAASGEQVSALINWYVWSLCLGQVFGTLGTIVYTGTTQETQIYVLIVVLAILTIAISCGMIFHKNLTIEPQSRNPWKIVFSILKYAATHKHPENRSALTYCEDPPTRMDLGKNRYGGPYTTEEVEDVKTFLRIMVVTFSLIMSIIAFFLCGLSANNLFIILQGVGDPNSYAFNAIQFSYRASILIMLVPSYEFIIYPFIRNRVPPMLRRLGICTFGVIIMSIYLLTIDIAGHYNGGHNITCIFNETQVENIEILPVHFAVLSIPFQILMSCVYLLFYVSIFQFICAQAPYSMKGLLLGFGFLVMFFSSYIADAVQLGIHKGWKHEYYSVNSLTTSCDFWFFITTLMISIAGLVIFSAVAKWYKKREREDPHNDRMFVEAYFERYCAISPK